MKTEAVALLEGLEAWVDKQAQNLDLAQNTEHISGNFDSLLKVLDSLYQVGFMAGMLLLNRPMQPAPCHQLNCQQQLESRTPAADEALPCPGAVLATDQDQEG